MLRRRACVALLCTLLPILGAQAAGLPRIEILGQSQTLGWFEQLAIPVYQGRFVLGSGFYQWAEPEHSIWQTEVSTVNGVSPYRSEQIDGVIITIGRPSLSNEYYSPLRQLIEQVRDFYPALTTIYLMPLISGPGGELCMVDGQVADPTLNRAAIERVIDQLVLQDSGLRKGPILEVRHCSEYNDPMGHVSTEASQRFANDMTRYFFTLGD